ncbi:hypothetical protein NQ315_001336 [Exocentrus adspersus]|uniref:THAP-type domain-containing protein n=1 Tax=Exocentrus adspersus TaxID=1586481 RepID=A0AAV8WHD3_9CUCU|nr:hypothetical protein NQ315_001336 [Exocentrus adspersus]
MVYNCCVKGCESGYRKRAKMHCFPKDPLAPVLIQIQLQRFQLWLHAIDRRDITEAKARSYRICDKHFSEDQKFDAYRNRTNLKAVAVPDLHLPEAQNEYNSSFTSETQTLRLPDSPRGCKQSPEGDDHIEEGCSEDSRSETNELSPEQFTIAGEETVETELEDKTLRQQSLNEQTISDLTARLQAQQQENNSLRLEVKQLKQKLDDVEKYKSKALELVQEAEAREAKALDELARINKHILTFQYVHFS